MQARDNAIRPRRRLVHSASYPLLSPCSRSSRSRCFARRGRQHPRNRLRSLHFRVRGPPGEQQVARCLGEDRDDHRSGGHRRSRRRLDRPRRDERRPGRQGRVDPDRSLGVPVRRHERHVLRGHGRRLSPEVRPARLEHRGGHLAPVRRPRDGQAEVVVARLGRRQAPSARRSTCRAATGRWYPQAVAENWNGGTGACNTYSYRFTDVSLAQSSGGVWRPLRLSSEFQDPGYHVVPISNTPRSFLAASLAA